MLSRNTRRRAHSATRGFTLVELMIVLAIIAILAAMAYPTYLDSIRTARRSDAMDALLTLQGQQEMWRANNSAYGTLTNLTGAAAATSIDSHYDLAVAGNNATAYVLTADATNTGTTQADDAGCIVMTLTVNAANPRGVKTPTDCWRT